MDFQWIYKKKKKNQRKQIAENCFLHVHCTTTCHLLMLVAVYKQDNYKNTTEATNRNTSETIETKQHHEQNDCVQHILCQEPRLTGVIPRELQHTTTRDQSYEFSRTTFPIQITPSHSQGQPLHHTTYATTPYLATHLSTPPLPASSLTRKKKRKKKVERVGMSVSMANDSTPLFWQPFA